jgi:hypothetical protein
MQKKSSIFLVITLSSYTLVIEEVPETPLTKRNSVWITRKKKRERI